MCTVFTYLGRHCCLVCEVTADLLIVPRAQRKKEKIELRSLQRIKSDLQSFVDDGNDLKKAKFHNNVISPNFFDIELEQV